MFAGRRRRSSNIRVMQLFHELKQQFPTVPDHVVTSCISAHALSTSPGRDSAIREVLEAAAALAQQEPMGRHPPHAAQPSDEAVAERNEMNDGDSDINRNVVKTAGVKFSKKLETVSVCTSRDNAVKRPDKLDLKPDTAGDLSTPRSTIQLSEKCKDVHKLLNSDNLGEKPPRSPVTHKRITVGSPTISPDNRLPPSSPDVPKRLQTPEELRRKKTASTPTQTTDTLLGGNSVNLSLNVNCSMDLVQSPTGLPSRRKSVLQLTPTQPWLEEPSSPRSYTSVNLTLRPPSSEPQPPIDITSQNSSLTYSTSSFDSQKGVQSRLQITVGPGGGSVSASGRIRPSSSYHPEANLEEVAPNRAMSMNNLTTSCEPPVILKQQARIERLRIELRSEKAKLEVMHNEVTSLEQNRNKPVEYKIDAEVEKQLRKEIKHLQYQCEQLALEVDKSAPVDIQEDFYHNIYTGQRGPLSTPSAATRFRLEGRFAQPPFSDIEDPKWNCHLCTFLNHPDLDKCEQCEMPRILHGKSPSQPNINYNIQQPRPADTNYNLVPSFSLPNFHETGRGPVVNRPIGFLVDNDLNCVAQSINQCPQFTRPN